MTAHTRRLAMTDPAELLLFVTEPQQLDAVFEFGTETLSPSSIHVAPRPTPRRRCAYCPKAVGANGYECAEHDDLPIEA